MRTNTRLGLRGIRWIAERIDLLADVGHASGQGL